MNSSSLKQISKPIIRAAVFLLVSLAGSFYLIGQINKILESVVEKRAMLSLYQNSQEQFAVLKEDVPKVFSYLDTVENVFPSSENIIPFINTMEGLAVQTGVQQSFKFENIAPTPISGTELNAVPFSVVLSGNKGQFLNYLASLEKLPYFTKVESFSMTTAQNFEGQSQMNIRGLLFIK